MPLVKINLQLHQMHSSIRNKHGEYFQSAKTHYDLVEHEMIGEVVLWSD